jgi:hypothetical protein
VKSPEAARHDYGLRFGRSLHPDADHAMPFDYYDRLSRRQKVTYRKSDAISEVPLSDPGSMRPVLEEIRQCLEADDRAGVGRAVRTFIGAMVQILEVPPVRTQVLAKRPSTENAELHGLYTREEGVTPLIQVWMRTAAHEQPVAFRTFLRTLLHELCHHLDFELHGLEDTFHTEGFFRRESSLIRQLLGSSGRARQLRLFEDDG